MKSYNRNTTPIAAALAIVAIAAIIWFFVIRTKSPMQEAQPVTQSETQVIRPVPKNETADWQVYEDQKFRLLVPPLWHKNPRGPGQLILSDNSPYYLNFSVIPLDQFGGSATVKSLYLSGKLLEAEQEIIRGLCGETGACGETMESRVVPIVGGNGIEFVVRYKGLRVDEPRGFSNEIHRTILKDGVAYRFWTSEKVAPEELKNEYPEIDPSPTGLFKKILDTFETR